ncbi:hypothetical protein [Moraxella lacunata]
MGRHHDHASHEPADTPHRQIQPCHSHFSLGGGITHYRGICYH